MTKKESKKGKGELEMFEENLSSLYEARLNSIKARDNLFEQIDSVVVYLSFVILMFSLYFQAALVPLWILCVISIFSILITHLVAMESHKDCINQINKIVDSGKLSNIRTSQTHKVVCKILNVVAYTCFVLQFIALIAF